MRIEMNLIKNGFLWSLILVSLFLLSGKAMSQEAEADEEIPTQTDQSIHKLIMAYRMIDAYYLDSMDHELLVEKAIIGMLKELDPHSTYFTKEQIKRANESLIGSFSGIGIQYHLIEDTLIVLSVVKDGPADHAGLILGDRIVKVNGDDVTGEKLTISFITKKLRGEKGSLVNITIARGKERSLLDFSFKRGRVPLYSMDAACMLSEETGYIKLNRFSRSTVSEFKEGLKKLQSDGMEHLILDLRGNSGGYLNTAVDLADQFLRRGELITYTEGLHNPRKDYNASMRGRFKDGRLVVLIDEGSASAAEILSGAIQDWDRGLIVGRRSFGKGLVQKPFTLNDGSVIRLVIAKYYSPTGRCIQRPFQDGKEEYYKDLSDRFSNGELMHPDSIDFPESLRFSTPMGREVYGGGGIMPDVFIPLDTSGNSKYYQEMRRQFIFFGFSYQYLYKHRNDILNKHPDVITFYKEFEMGDSILSACVQYAEKRGVVTDTVQIEKSRELMIYSLRNAFVRNLYGYSDTFWVNAQFDKVLLKAVELIEKESMPEDFNLSME